jgi:predicted RND superfamily exporter protein
VAKVDKAKGTEVTVAGSLTFFYAWEEAVRSGFAASLILSVLTIVVVLFFVFRNPITAVFIMVPILVAVLAAFGTMHFINIPLNFLPVMFGAITLGLGVDYSIHLVQRYHEELERLKELTEAGDDKEVEAGAEWEEMMAKRRGKRLNKLFRRLVR